MLITDTFPLYVGDKNRRKPFSANTVRQYTYCLDCMAAWLGPDANLAQTTEAQMLAYFVYLRDVKGYTRTLHLHWTAMRGWEKWLVKNKQVPAKFLPEVELPEWKAPREQQVSDRECVALIEACALIKDDYDRAMYTALLYVLLTTCLRHDEIINLKIDDISLDEFWIEVQKGKGDKYRRFKMCDQCVEALRTYMVVRFRDCRHDWLFARCQLRRVGYDGLYDILERVKQLAGLGHAAYIKPHRLRKAAASRQHHNGASVEAMKTILGHTSLVTAQIYLKTGDAVLDAVRNFSALPLDPPQSPAPAPQAATTPPIDSTPTPADAPRPKCKKPHVRRPRRRAPLRLVFDEDGAASA